MVVSEDEPLDPKALLNKGRTVGMQAATMTTFCSTLGRGKLEAVNR